MASTLAPRELAPRASYVHWPSAYLVDLTLARDVSTGAKLATITEVLTGCQHSAASTRGNKPVEDLIGPWNRAIVSYEPADGGTDETMQVSLRVDLGRSYTLGVVYVRISASLQHASAPRSIAVWVSDVEAPDEDDWTEVLSERPYPIDRADPEVYRLNGTGSYAVDLAHTPGRHVRVDLRGAVDGLLELEAISVYPSIFGEPLTIDDGLPVNGLPGISTGSPTNGTRSSSGWADAPSVLTYYRQGVVHFQGKSSGVGGSVADAWAIIDLTRTVNILGFDCGFYDQANGDPDYRDSWCFGARIETSADYDPTSPESATWETVFDTDERWFGGWVDLSAAPKAARAVRLTNKGGTYPDGETKPGSAIDLGGQNGTGLGRLTGFVVIGGSPAKVAPEPVATVTLEEPGWLSVTALDAGGTPVAELLSPVYLDQPRTVDVYWPGGLKDSGGDGLYGDPVPPGTYTIVATSGTVQSEPVGIVGAGVSILGLGDRYNGKILLDAAFSATVVPGNQRLLVAYPFGEAGAEGVAVFEPDGTYAYTHTLRGTYAVGADDTYAYYLQHDPPNNSVVNIRLFRGEHSNSEKPTTLANATVLTLVSGHDRTTIDPGQPGQWQAWRCLQVAPQRVGAFVFVSDYVGDRIMTLTKSPLAIVQETALSVTKPIGVACDPDGSLWVAHSGDRIEKFAVNSDGTLSPTPVQSITGLVGPTFLAIADLGGEEGVRLLAHEWGIADYGEPTYDHAAACKHRIREWDINGAPTPGGAYEGFGRDYRPGPYYDDAWLRPYALAMTDAGDLVVGDLGLKRAVRFRRSDGVCVGRFFRDFGCTSTVDKETATAESHTVGNAMYRFRVRTDGGTYTAEEGGFSNGLAKIETALLPIDQRWTHWTYTAVFPFWLTCPDGQRRRFFARFDNWRRRGLVVFADETDRGGYLRRCYMLGTLWTGDNDEINHNDAASQTWSYVDEAGDGTFNPLGLAESWTTNRPIDYAHVSELAIDHRDGSILVCVGHPNLIVGSPYEGDVSFAKMPCRIPVSGFVDHGGGRYTPIWRIADLEPILTQATCTDPDGRLSGARSLRPHTPGRLVARMLSSLGSNRNREVWRFWAEIDLASKTIVRRGLMHRITSALNLSKVRSDGRHIYDFETSTVGVNPWHRIFGAESSVPFAYGAGRANLWAESWTDSDVADDAILMPDGDTAYAYQMSNGQGHAVVWKATGLTSRREQTAVIAYDPATWDGSGKAALTFTATGGGEDPDPPPVSDKRHILTGFPGPRPVGLPLIFPV